MRAESNQVPGERRPGRPWPLLPLPTGGKAGAGLSVSCPVAYRGGLGEQPGPLRPPDPEEDLARLELCLRDSVTGDDPFLNEVASHLIDAGGKRLRPSLTHRGLVPPRRRGHADTLLGGVSVELVHLASLYHDDVMDEATDGAT